MKSKAILISLCLSSLALILASASFFLLVPRQEQTSPEVKATSSSVVKTIGEQTKNPSSSSSSSSTITQENEPNETTPSSEPEQEKPASKRIKKQLSVQPQIQTVWNYCAPTTVSMMLSSQGVHVGQKQLAFEMGTYEPFGTHNRDAIRILNKHLFGYEYPTDGQAGYRLATVTDPNPAGQEMALFKQRVRENIDAGYPMYYTFDSAVMYPSKKGEHNVIGIGYLTTEDGKDIEQLYYLDPSPNVQDPRYGGLKVTTAEELFQALMTCEEPNYGW